MMKKNRFSRRRFMKGGLMLGAGAAAFGSRGFDSILPLALGANPNASQLADRYFIFCYFGGAWDILLSLDPRDPMIFNSGSLQTYKTLPGYDLLDDETNDGSLISTSVGKLGPYIGELQYLMDDVAIVRGMSMDTLTHQAGRRRFLTGRPPSGLTARGSSAATWFASLLGKEQPIPNLSVKVESFNEDQPNYATGMKVNSVPDLVLALEDANPQLGALQNAQLDALLETFAQCHSAQKSAYLQTAEESRQKAREMVSGGYGGLFEFESMDSIMDHYKIPTTGSNNLSTPEAQGAMAVTAITSGISRVVSIEVAANLDTHYDTWTTDQGPNQEQGFNVVARIITDLKDKAYPGGNGESWFDHVTIVGFSEFARGAMINQNLGRDHSLTNACFLAGAGIKGGQIIGESSNYGMAPTKTNLVTGVKDDDQGVVVRPENILHALFHDIGISDDPADLREEPLLALLKS